MLIMFAAGVALVAARASGIGPGAALKAVIFFIVMRGLLSLLVGGLGETAAHFPLYIAEARSSRASRCSSPPSSARSSSAPGAGVLIGTVGLAAEWGWSHVWMPLPWPAEILPQVAMLGLAAALAGSLIGAWMGARLGADDIPQVSGLRWAGLAGAVAMTAMVASGCTPRAGRHHRQGHAARRRQADPSARRS